ncbi:pyridoxal phosphate-dependent aminotransferase [Candidatus Kaiserbacteria bacterium]|nr:pyridoxal phosphate-dependent aminotransferase [Candidatus Kaiserbacteria bacterium]
MRQSIVHPGAENLKYEIREIVEIAKRFNDLGVPIVWENIGDPVGKGEQVPDWIREHLIAAMHEDNVYGYSPTKGLLSTREYIAYERNIEGGIQITPGDILFFNGLGDAISKLYRNLHKDARIIGPNPAYPTHSSAEAAHADSAHITYSLDPQNGWKPDLNEMEEKIVQDPNIVGILIVNPDNPTGFVYDIPTMERIVTLAQKYDLFIISDEIYSNLVYGEVSYKKLAGVIGDVPGIGMRGISKEFPWPGARCGWIEFYNRDKDPLFNQYTQAIIDSKMLEVCSTTLPQRTIPTVMKDERYFPYLKDRCSAYKEKALIAKKIFSEVPELIVEIPDGAFYMTAVFRDGSLTTSQTLAIENDAVRGEVEKLTLYDMALDKRFVYYLLGATGICVVPMTTGFNATCNGFRFTLLEPDVEKFTEIMGTIRDAVVGYLKS